MWPQPSSRPIKEQSNSKSSASQMRTWAGKRVLPGRQSTLFFLTLSRNPGGHLPPGGMSGPSLSCDPKSSIDWELEEGSPSSGEPLIWFRWKWGNIGEELQQNPGLCWAHRTSYLDVWGKRFSWSYGSPWLLQSKKNWKKKKKVFSLQDEKERKQWEKKVRN